MNILTVVKCYNYNAMSGHSKWSTIKRQKEVTDKRRGQLFSKLARAITLATRQGGSDPGTNLKLRLAIDQAREANMPKDNIERALRAAQGKLDGELEEILYEGYAPFGVAVIVEAATDNRNRTAQEIKNLFDRGGGSLGGPGAVSYQFEKKGLIVIEKGLSSEETMLSLIDLGAPNIEESDDGIEIYVGADEISSWRDKLERAPAPSGAGQAGFRIKSAELVYRPKVYVDIHDREKAKKVLKFLNELDEHDDVQRVFANLDIPEDLLQA